MQTFSRSGSQPITLAPSTESSVYGLFGLALALTTAGVFTGLLYAGQILGTGTYLLFTIAEFAILLTSGLWANRSPLNMILFLIFPFLSGITITPYLLMVLTGYANGGAILLNAFAATACTTFAMALVARSGVNLQGLRGALVFGIVGLLVFSLFQIFIPGLRTGLIEIVVSGFSIALFAGFTAYDLQRIQALGKAGANPFQLALSLYLDIFNLFLSILRFMLAVSGGRRD